VKVCDGFIGNGKKRVRREGSSELRVSGDEGGGGGGIDEKR
jgi:hypothetical protein